MERAVAPFRKVLAPEAASIIGDLAEGKEDLTAAALEG